MFGVAFLTLTLTLKVVEKLIALGAIAHGAGSMSQQDSACNIVFTGGPGQGECCSVPRLCSNPFAQGEAHPQPPAGDASGDGIFAVVKDSIRGLFGYKAAEPSQH